MIISEYSYIQRTSVPYRVRLICEVDFERSVFQMSCVGWKLCKRQPSKGDRAIPQKAL